VTRAVWLAIALPLVACHGPAETPSVRHITEQAQDKNPNAGLSSEPVLAGAARVEVVGYPDRPSFSVLARRPAIHMDCVRGCVRENNQDRRSGIRYIRIHEMQKGDQDFGRAEDDFFHEVPAAGHFYIGTQCFHCQNPPCVDVCPVQATWMEPDGIVVVDYNWCIGCRYCIAACPYDARRFNWADPVVPEDEVNPNQHYLGNRLRKKGVVEKCTFCIQRSRDGKNPACVEACPTGARVFGNLLDPDSEIRWVLEHKKVFRLKEDLGTEPKFWYYMD
jgi:Fe-S-cluster-containing dehydrogenase component